jgi:ATP-dependent helicase YprA (DUF1998 family)
LRDRDGLIARIRQVRRATATTTAAAAESGKPAQYVSDPDHVRALEARVEHLESLVQGLQDSVHRESSRHAKLIAELEARTQPAVLGKALSDDARERGL